MVNLNKIKGKALFLETLQQTESEYNLPFQEDYELKLSLSAVTLPLGLAMGAQINFQ
jgi:hypothetical protein